MYTHTGYLVIAIIPSKWYGDVIKNIIVFRSERKAKAFIARAKTTNPVSIIYNIEPIEVEGV